jgi:hypothetical protein
MYITKFRAPFSISPLLANFHLSSTRVIHFNTMCAFHMMGYASTRAPRRARSRRYTQIHLKPSLCHRNVYQPRASRKNPPKFPNLFITLYIIILLAKQPPVNPLQFYILLLHINPYDINYVYDIICSYYFIILLYYIIYL